ncbi:MAG: penicillin-binding transpeptidase domain-containing protein [Acidimicrobiia bacterium]
MNRAIGRVGTAVVALMLVLVGMLTYLQVIHADSLANDPRNVRGALKDINRPRGPIVTADGTVVAKSTRVNDRTEFDFQRSYPDAELFQQVVGYQSFVLGSIGVERTYNDELIGRDPELQIRGLDDAILGGQEPVGTVVLSVRADLQRAAADALGDQRGSVVAIDPRTGEVLAMYANPTYNQEPLAGHNTKKVNQYYRFITALADKPDLARAYRERYPPGSTFKTITASVALENGVATPDRVFPEISSLDLPQTDLELDNFGGQVCGGTLAVSFRRSCNTTFGQLGLDLGDAFVPGMERFGIGDVPPIDLVPEAALSIGPRPNSFQDEQPQFALAGVGQGPVATTPLEMCLAAAGIANGGVIMEPHVVREIRDADDGLVRRIAAREWKTAVSPATAQAVAAMMVTVVEAGTGTAAQIEGVTVAGKTGTAQTDSGDPHAWFVAFSPAGPGQIPEIAIAVIVEHGGNAGSEATGGQVAAPIAAAVMRAYLGR